MTSKSDMVYIEEEVISNDSWIVEESTNHTSISILRNCTKCDDFEKIRTRELS